MAMVIKYCEGCGERVSTEDLERASAVLYKELAYCRKCKAQILPLIEQEKQAQKPKKSMGPTTGKTISAGVIKPPISAVRRPQSTIQAKTISGERRRPAVSNNTNLVIFLGAGSVILILLILFFVFSGPNENHPKDENPFSKEDPNKKNPDPVKKDPIKNPDLTKEPIKDPAKEELSQVAKKLSELQLLDYAEAKEKFQELKKQFTSEKTLEQINLAWETLAKKHNEEAKEQFDRTKEKADKILEKAIKSTTATYAKTKFTEAEYLWKSFPKKYEDTSFWEEKEKEMARIQRERESKQSGNNNQESLTPKDDKNVMLKPRQGKWDFDKETGIISVQTEGTPGLLEISENLNIKEFLLTVEIKIEKGTPQIHVHMPEDKNAKHLIIGLNNPSEGKWQKITVQFNGKLYNIQINDGQQTFDPVKEECVTSGRICLGCTPESLVYYRNLNLKIE
ncbi:MAG: hypothetical protein AABZ60_20335 [Planctomycetota bacterium]